MTKETLVDDLAWSLSRKLGRPVKVVRVQSMEFDPRKAKSRPSGRAFKAGPLRYNIVVPGCSPEVFPGMTINECKARITMLSDMLSSDVIRKGSEHDSTVASSPTRGESYQPQSPA